MKNNPADWVYTETDTVDWDRILLDADWENLDWRQQMLDFQLVPWSELRKGTLRRLATLHARYDETHVPSNSWPVRSPAADELLRRRELEENNIGTENQSVSDWLSEDVEMFSPAPTPAPDIPLPDLPEIFQSPVPNTPTEGNATSWGKGSWGKGSWGEGSWGRASTPINQTGGENKIPGLVYKDDPNGYWTIGFELELPVAVHRKGGLMAERPHPHDCRWEAENIVTDEVPKHRINQVTVDRFLEVLNSQTDMVFIRRDEDEGTALHDLRMEEMHRLEHRLPPLSEIMHESPLIPLAKKSPISAAAESAAVKARDFLKLSYFNNSTPARSFILASRGELRDAARRAIMPGIPSPSERRDAENRLEELLHLEAYIQRRDRHHIPLIGMRPRYRAFSVYAVDEINMDCTKGKQYRFFSDTEEDPEDLYGWVTIKISSPAMLFEWPPSKIENIITNICRVVRDNFRVHRDSPWIPATTQISISHSSGLTLTDIQKLSSFLGTEAVFNNLRYFNRWYRTRKSHDKVCGPIRTVSQLGKLSQTNQNTDNFNNSGIVPVHGPQLTQQLNQRAAEHLPIDLIMQRENLAGRNFQGMIWQYTNVDSIVAAVGTGSRSCKAEVIMKCRGLGTTTGGASPSPEQELIQDSVDHDRKFFEVDRQRGVFEFRQMGGSLDPSHITAWMSLCCRIVHFVKTSTPAQYRFALEQIMGDGVSVMDAINVPFELQQYFHSHVGQNGYVETEFSSNSISIDWRDPFYPPYSK
ncbi:hypothetical protein GL218_02389 [Daldinia childiae]|uniref:uncharacterized protein n=1 Tax=Daldinia childiae TaxID=326645 RepID=UPI001447E201|nr:uncharacterized protein GL218_02389 [Daldinia childiae]KAF3064192.1 hypothetical protein GL218_02389 [Daldinia childiae]